MTLEWTVVVLVTICLASQVYAFCGAYYVYKHDCAVPYGKSLAKHLNLPSVISCAHACSCNVKCVAVIYYHDLNICVTNYEVTSRFRPGCVGTVTYAEKTTSNCTTTIIEGAASVSIEDLLGSPAGMYDAPSWPIGHQTSNLTKECFTSAACSAPRSGCYHSVCRCDSGYSFNPANNSCISYCNVYGSTYQHEIGAIVSTLLSFEKLLYDVTVRACADACINETTFVCRAAGYWRMGQVCWLSRETAWTPPGSNLRMEHSDYDVIQRDCA